MTVDVAVPERARVVTSSSGSRVDRGAVRFTAAPSTPRSFWVRYAA